jgi:hypothetical protein
MAICVDGPGKPANILDRPSLYKLNDPFFAALVDLFQQSAAPACSYWRRYKVADTF